MIARARPLTAEKEAELLEEYRQGASIWQLHMKHHPVTRGQIITLIHREGVVRQSTQKSDPSLQEIAERAAEIRANWTPEEAAKRYVARGSKSFHSSLAGEGDY